MGPIATTEATETPTGQVLRVPRVVWPIRDWSSQKVLLVRCTKNNDPAPADNAISTGSRPSVGPTGATGPAGVIAEMATEPPATCGPAPTSHTIKSGAQ